MNILEYAIKMEEDGRDYYNNHALKTNNEALKTVCKMLSRDEMIHVKILKKKLDNIEYQLDELEDLDGIENVFNSLKDEKLEKDNLTQLEFYRESVKMEEESISLYKDLIKIAKDEKEEKLFTYLIEQEEHHKKVLEEIERLIFNAGNWVESPEFGLRREEY